MKNLFALVFVLSLVSFHAAAASKTSIICSLKAAKSDIALTSVELDVDQLPEDYLDSNNVDIGEKDNYSFNLLAEKGNSELSIYVTFYENKHVQDEVASAGWTLTFDEISKAKNGHAVITEPLENEDGHVADFVCQIKKAK